MNTCNCCGQPTTRQRRRRPIVSDVVLGATRRREAPLLWAQWDWLRRWVHTHPDPIAACWLADQCALEVGGSPSTARHLIDAARKAGRLTTTRHRGGQPTRHRVYITAPRRDSQ